MNSKQIKTLILAHRFEEERLHVDHVAAIIREKEAAAYHPLKAFIPEVPTIKKALMNFFRKLFAL